MLILSLIISPAQLVRKIVHYLQMCSMVMFHRNSGSLKSCELTDRQMYYQSYKQIVPAIRSRLGTREWHGWYIQPRQYIGDGNFTQKQLSLMNDWHRLSIYIHDDHSVQRVRESLIPPRNSKLGLTSISAQARLWSNCKCDASIVAFSSSLYRSLLFWFLQKCYQLNIAPRGVRLHIDSRLVPSHGKMTWDLLLLCKGFGPLGTIRSDSKWVDGFGGSR